MRCRPASALFDDELGELADEIVFVVETAQVKLETIVALPYEDTETAYKLFLQGECDWLTAVPTAKIDEVKRHADYYAAEADGWSAAMDTEREIQAFNCVMAETDNLRVAYANSVAQDPARACRLALAMALVLTHAGPGQWFDDMLDQAIELARGLDDSALLANLLVQRARAHRLVARPEPARADATEAADRKIKLLFRTA